MPRRRYPCEELHVSVTTGGGFISELIHFTTALLISLVLLVLTIRAARLPGTPVANMFFAACGILWSAGGLIRVFLRAAGLTWADGWVLAADALQFTGAAAFPIAILSVWQPFAKLPWQKRAIRLVLFSACASATAIAVFLWTVPAIGSRWAPLATAVNAALFLAAGAAITLRRRSTPRSVYVPSLLIVTALCASALMYVARQAEFVAAHLILLMMLCTFLLFARFRLADLFIRYTLRILLAAVWAGILAGVSSAPPPFQMARQTHFPQVIHAFFMVLGVNLMLVSFTFVDVRLSGMVNRWLFRAPDYRAEIRALSLALRDLREESEIARAVEDAARRPLELSKASVAPLEAVDAWPAALHDGEIVERDGDLLVPMVSGGRTTHLLQATPGPARPGLVSRDLDYLRSIATQFGNRLDALSREREAIDRQSREALLLQQVTEAELRALRAQINPHFLFNSLNTVADLIVRDPVRAEAMTVRLAGVFRHVLAHSSRPLTTIRDEVEFLRTYLYIEEARFGDRLQVTFDVAADVLADQAPSLILQPLVENALKHGLGPKPGPGHLWISAQAEGGRMLLRVEDDGMGLERRQESQGLGLTNVAERLRTLYQDRASVLLESRPGGGCRVTLRFPRDGAVIA
jgi:two-component system LytT family sensor kinase